MIRLSVYDVKLFSDQFQGNNGSRTSVDSIRPPDIARRNQQLGGLQMDLIGVIGDGAFMLRLVEIVEKRLQGGFWICDLPSRETFWSDGMYAILDVDRTQVSPVLGAVNARVHPDDRLAASELEMIVSGGMTVDREMRIVTDNGRLRWVSKHIEFVMNADRKPARMIGILFDITQEVELRHAVGAHRQRFNVLAQAATLFAWSADPDGSVERISGWNTVTGLPEQSAEGWNWAAGVHPQDRDGAVDSWREAVESGQPYERELRLLRHDGGYRWILARASPVRGADGVILEWIGAAVDIQARKEWVMDPMNCLGVTGAQLRAARGLLNWSVSHLAEVSGISSSAIRRLEEFDGMTKGEAAALSALKAALSRAGVEFIFPPSGKPGVRPA
jgi:PAS domain S-box-containing protein